MDRCGAISDMCTCMGPTEIGPPGQVAAAEAQKPPASRLNLISDVRWPGHHFFYRQERAKRSVFFSTNRSIILSSSIIVPISISKARKTNYLDIC